MIKTVTRALYIDGKPIAEFTQDPLEWSELADLENIAARMELLERQKEAQNRAYVGHNAADPRCPLGKGRPKALQFKLKLLQAVSKILLLSHKTTVESHVVCLYVEHHIETPAKESPHTTQA